MHGVWSPRWLIVGRFGNPSSGKIIRLSGSGLSRTMASIAPEFHIHHPTLVYTGFSEGIRVKFSRPRDFGWSRLPNKISLWSSLLDVANNLEKGRLGPTEAWGHIGRLMGATAWWDEVQKSSEEFIGDNGSASQKKQEQKYSHSEATAINEARSGPTSNAVVSNFSGFESIFSKVMWPTQRSESLAESRKVLDEFVRVISRGVAQDDAATRKDLVQRIRYLVEEGTAVVWMDPGVERAQSLWKGLNFLVGNNSGTRSATIDLLDANNEQMLAILHGEGGTLRDIGTSPDCIFLTEEPEFALFKQILDFAEASHIPVVVPVDSWLKLDERKQLCSELREERSPEKWIELRKHPGARWVCAAANSFVVGHEQHLGMDHTVFATAAIAIAAMLSASYCQTGGFSHFGDRQVPIVSPATWFHQDAQSDSLEERPVRASANIAVQSELGELGIVTIASGQRVTEIRANGNVGFGEGTRGFGIAPKIIVGKVIRSVLESVEEVAFHSTGDAICRFCRLEVERNLALAHPMHLELSIHSSNATATVIHGVIELSGRLAGAPIRSEFQLPMPAS